MVTPLEKEIEMKFTIKVLSAFVLTVLSAGASMSVAALERVVTDQGVASSRVATATPVAVVTVETVKDINQIPVVDQQPQVKAKRPIQAVREKVRVYAKKKGIEIADHRSGKTFCEGYATVSKNRASPEYGKALVMAYQEAYMQALSNFAQQLEVQVSDQLEQELFSDTSSNAREFEPDAGQSKISVLFSKGMALAEAKLDDALRKLGTTDAQLKSMSLPEKKTLYRNAVKQVIREHASLALGGINIQQNFIESDQEGNSAVGVLIAYSAKMASVAESLARGEKPLLQAVGQPLSQLLPLDKPEKLAQNFGPRLLIDDQGPVIVSFGLWSSSYTGSDDIMASQYESTALEIASADANAQIARFLSISFTTDKETQRGNESERSVEKDSQTGQAGADVTKNVITERLSKQNLARANARLSGLETLTEWSWQLPEGQLLVGVVKAYRFAGIENARKALEEPESTASEPNDKEKQAYMEGVSSQGSVETNLDVF